MASYGTHRNKANQNQRFLDTIDAKQFPGWVAAVAFYTALHLVEAMAARTHKHHKGHGSRHQFLKKEHEDLWKDYLPLFNLSLIARYGAKKIKAAHVEQAQHHLGALRETLNSK